MTATECVSYGPGARPVRPVLAAAAAAACDGPKPPWPPELIKSPGTGTATLGNTAPDGTASEVATANARRRDAHDQYWKLCTGLQAAGQNSA